MNSLLLYSWRRLAGIAFIAVFLAAGDLAPAGAADSDQVDLRERDEQVGRQSDSKAERNDERDPSAVRKRLEKRARAERSGDPELRDRPAPRQMEQIRRERQQALRHLEELRSAGKMDQASAAKARIQEMERQMERMEQDRTPPGRRERPALERRDGPGDPRQRAEHLNAAIRNLHAAGMHDLADRLAQQSESGPPRRLQRRGPRPGPSGSSAELNQLREEVRDLRQAVRELRAQSDRTEPKRKLAR